jgi:chromate transporter
MSVQPAAAVATAEVATIPHQTLGGLFGRFLRFGFLAWGGPVAQIAMIKRELVEEERWITTDRFNRVYAVYQVLPGPEAHELCVYFGTLARGRIGGLLAGLGFMLPGFVLMFALSWAYVRYGMRVGAAAAVFAGLQAAVIGLIARAIHRIGKHALTDLWLLGIAVVSAATTAAGLHFLIGLALAGLVYEAICRKRMVWAGLAGAAWTGLTVVAWQWAHAGVAPQVVEVTSLSATPSTVALFGSGLRAGLLTFGGAYTVIPYLQHDAVRVGAWMTDPQFLDGLALSGILPAPLIIFATFVGYLGAAALGAVAVTVGIFLPAFGFTLVGHELFERLTHSSALRNFLAGMTAGVIGLIVVTTIKLASVAINGWVTAGIAGVSLLLLYAWKAKAAVVGVLALAAMAGGLLLGSAS